MYKNILLFGGAAARCEGIARIAREPSWKVAAVVRIVAAGHPNFVTGINLWNSAQSQQQRKCGFQFGGAAVLFTHKAPVVVISDERNQHLWVEIEVVVAKNIDNLLHRCTFNHHVAQNGGKREVNGCCKPGIDAIKLLSPSCKKRCDGRIAVGHFADVVDLRIDFMQSLVPSAPELARGI